MVLGDMWNIVECLTHTGVRTPNRPTRSQSIYRLHHFRPSIGLIKIRNVMFEFPCVVSLYYIRNQQDATVAVSFISHCKITLHVSDIFCVHHREY